MHLLGFAGWTCYTQQRLLHSHKLHPFSSLLPLSYQNSDVHLFFMPKALCPLFSHSCFPITAMKNFPRIVWHWSEMVAVLHDGECQSALYPAVFHLVGGEAVEELPLSEQVWWTAGITYSLCERGKYEEYKKCIKCSLM